MHPITLQYRDKIQEQQYSNQIRLSTQNVIIKYTKALMILATMAFVYQAYDKQLLGSLSCVSFQLFAFSVLYSIKRSLFLFEILAVTLEIMLFSVAPGFAFLQTQFGIELNSMTTEFSSYLGGQIVYFFCQSFFGSQRFTSKAVVITYGIIISFASSIYQTKSLGVLEISLLLIGMQTILSIYKNEQILRESFIAQSRELLLWNSLDVAIEVSLLQCKLNLRHKRIDLIRASRYSVQQIGVHDQDTFITFLRNSEVVLGTRNTSQSLTTQFHSFQGEKKKNINLENMVYTSISKINNPNERQIYQIIHNKQLYRLKTFTFIQNNQSVYHMILEKLEENQSVKILKDLDAHNRKIIESLLELYPKYLIPALMQLKRNIHMGQQKSAPILQKLYKSTFRFINIQIFNKSRNFDFQPFDLYGVLKNVRLMNKLMGKKFDLSFLPDNITIDMISSKILVFLVLINTIKLFKLQKTGSTNADNKIIIRVRRINTLLVPIIKFTLITRNQENHSSKITNMDLGQYPSKHDTILQSSRLDEQILLEGSINRILKLIGTSNFLRHSETHGIKKIEFQLFEQMQKIPENEFRV